MKKYNFCIVTPSYAPDFERCQLLSQSIEKFISPANTTHYILVDRKDLKLFRKIKEKNTQIIPKESILPWWILHSQLSKKWWISLKSLPIRGWIVQQISKLSVAEHFTEDIFIFVDSDVVFIRPFNLYDLILNGKVSLFREPATDSISMSSHYMWHQSAHRLLCLPPPIFPAPGYIGQIVAWRRENILKLYRHIEMIDKRNWIVSLANLWQFSEYILYGTFCEHVLKEESGHYFDSKILCHNYWSHQDLTNVELIDFLKNTSSQHIGLMISSKANIPVCHYKDLIIKMFDI